MTLLPPTFRPGPFDVLCGRGRACKDAAGNKAYREIITHQLQEYADATTKLAKGQIISNIMEQIKHQCHVYHQAPVGGFVKQMHGRWYDVGEFLAREKTSQCFRDALAALYSSSAQSKYLRRRASKEMTMTTTTTTTTNGRNNEVQHLTDVSRHSSSRRRSSSTSAPTKNMNMAAETREVCYCLFLNFLYFCVFELDF
jgi:hypothetical protein